MDRRCPGSDIGISLRDCPQCGEEVELFTGESKAKCGNCGTLVYREKASCMDWCPVASDCFGSLYGNKPSANIASIQSSPKPDPSRST